MVPEVDPQVTINKFVLRAWQEAQNNFPAELNFYPNDVLTKVTLADALKSCNLKDVFIQGFQARLSNQYDQVYGGQVNPYLRLAFNSGWGSADSYLSIGRLRGQ